MLTSEERAITERCSNDTIYRDDINDALLNKEHPISESTLLNDDITRLVELKL